MKTLKKIGKILAIALASILALVVLVLGGLNIAVFCVNLTGKMEPL